MGKSIREYVEEYIAEESKKPMLRSSVVGLKSKLKKLVRYVEELGIGVGEVGVKQAQGYQLWLKEEGKKADNTVATLVIAASRFYEYLKRRGVVMSNAFKDIKRARLVRGIPKNILTEKEIKEVLEELSKFNQEESFYSKVRRYRAHVVAEFLYSTGCRISEASEVRVEDVDIERGEVKIKDRKSKKERVSFLNEYAKGVLKLYLEKMRKWVFYACNYDNGSIFGACGERLSIMLNRELEKVCKEKGVKKITSGSFRHIVGSQLLRAGCDLRYIQEILGHRRVKSTQIYTQIDKQDLREILDTYHPRGYREQT